MKTWYMILFLVVCQTIDVPCQSSSPRPPRPIINFPINDKEQIVGTIWPGIVIIIDRTDIGVSAVLKRTGNWPGMEIYHIFIKEGDVVLNVGSHVGFDGMVMGKIIGPKGKLFFFEPVQVSRNILIKNIYINDLQDISTVFPVAASNTKMKAYMMAEPREPTNTGTSNVVTNQTLAKAGFTSNGMKQIQVDTIDNLLPADVTPNFAFLDVQWLDVECLEGMKKTIERSPNLTIVTEWTAYSKLWPREVYVEHLQELLTWFKQLKYRFWRLAGVKDQFLRPTCQKRKFEQMSRQELLTFTDDLYRRRRYVDIVIAPAYVQPNLL